MKNYQLASRARIGVLIPSTNTGVEYDLQQFGLDGITWHASRFLIRLKDWAAEGERSGDDANTVFERFLDLMREDMGPAIENIMTAQITHLMLGMSAETFWGGIEGNIEFEQAIQSQIGDLGMTTGAAATRKALEGFGAKKISVITPYPPIGDDNVRRYFDEIGFEVKHVVGLNCTSATAIAEVTIPEVIAAVKKADGDDVDAIIQCGTNLSTLDLFPTLEHWLEKPMIPINVATIWHALRASGINDKITGKGRLLEEF
ncbi:Maleate isomerase [Zhongshania aliphaticivorans]|uniref:Maleate isomerase n=1 Tax=Zhongshania aliphaticivorans TaxID=1470434 RepID=A0A5S9N429_9GAMM|nr:Asp/Glu racemase [Zhongshania aliphaticivorans]CAA0082011.1 Maleate isomerase [Zhongshania aliphaticivorans]CAA0084522.1 Maleate isomerase [Zhongshania aliphaticivorans]